MKFRLLLALGFFILSQEMHAQSNTLPTSGNVGIGTTSPDNKLHVVGDIKASGIIGGNGMYLNVLKIPSLTSSPAYFYIDTHIPANDLPAPQLDITGYIYTGSNRAMKITLSWYYYYGNFYWTQFQSDFGYHKPSRVRLGKYTKNGNEYIRVEIANGIYFANYSVSATDRSEGTMEMEYYKGWTYTEGEMPESTTSQITTVLQPEVVSIDASVGIGISNPSEKLAVNGKIRAKEIKVEAANWPDYVFDKDYPLTSLPEIENFIKKNQHLIDVPSAEQITKNGYELGEMDKVLLKKIEELTLHLIEKDKQLRKQDNAINKLISQMNSLQDEIKKLKN